MPKLTTEVITVVMEVTVVMVVTDTVVTMAGRGEVLNLTKNPKQNLDPIPRLTLMPKQMPITVMVQVTVMVTDMVILTEPTIMERGALMPNLMVTTAMDTGKRLNTINSLIVTVAVLKY